MDLLWGIDMGGTKLEVAVVPKNNLNETLIRHRLPTNAHLGYDFIQNQIGNLIKEAEDILNIKCERVGLAMPGSTDRETGLAKNSNTTCINGRPFVSDLEKNLGIPVRSMNDANCFALAEVLMGALGKEITKSKAVFGVILGTGVGGGIVIDNKAIEGLHSIAGEWGHNVIDPSGELCYCGKKGCLETFISGKSLERYYSSISGTTKGLREIIQLVNTDTHAKMTLDRLYDYFGRAIAQIINVLDPHAVVVGGGVSNVDSLYTESRPIIEKYVFNNKLKTKIVKASLGDSAGVFGAALLWND